MTTDEFWVLHYTKLFFALASLPSTFDNEEEVLLPETVAASLQESLKQAFIEKHLLDAEEIVSCLNRFLADDNKNVISCHGRQWFSIRRGKRKNTYDITDQTPPVSTGFYCAQKSICNATWEEAVEFVQANQLEYLGRGTVPLWPEDVAKAYLQAVRDNSNPALVEAVDELLKTQSWETSSHCTPSSSGETSRDSTC